MIEGTPTGFEPLDSSSKSLESIRQYVDARLAEADRRYQMRYDFTDKALATAQDTNNTRLNAMNEFRATLADQATHLPTRQEVQVMIDGVRAEESKNLAPIQIKLDALGKPNLMLMAALFGTFLSIVSAAWVIIGLKIDATNLPVQVAIQSAKTDSAQLNSRILVVETNSSSSLQADTVGRADRAQLNDRIRSAENSISQSSQADGVSRVDRAQLNSRINTLETTVTQNTGETRALGASVTSKLVEVETQFKLLSDILNLNRDQDERLFTLIWKKTFTGQDLPPTMFRPQMFKSSQSGN